MVCWSELLLLQTEQLIECKASRRGREGKGKGKGSRSIYLVNMIPRREVDRSEEEG